jgi:hypothetical protein
MITVLSDPPHQLIRGNGFFLLASLSLLCLWGCTTPQTRAPESLQLRFTIGANHPVTTFDLMGARPVSFMVEEDGRRCRGSTGFSRFVEDTPVEIVDEHGSIVGRGDLGNGLVEAASPDAKGRRRYQACHFMVSIPLTDSARIYTIRIGGEAFVRREHISTLARTDGQLNYITD